MRFLIITVTDPSPASRDNLQVLLASLDRQGSDADLVLVMRGGGHPPRESGGAVRIHPIETPLVIGLSAARNRALAYARQQGMLDVADAVAFPDDDCAYPDGLLARVGETITEATPIVCGPYGPALEAVDRVRFPGDARPLSPWLVMRAVCSGTVFLAASVVRAVGDFDARLGLGGRYGASEDSDYVLRALAHGFRGVYEPTDVFVVHPYKPHRPDQYYLGNVVVLAKHALRRGGTFVLLARRLAFGAFMLARRRLAPRQYGRALGTAIALLPEAARARRVRTSAGTP